MGRSEWGAVKGSSEGAQPDERVERVERVEREDRRGVGKEERGGDEEERGREEGEEEEVRARWVE